MKKQRLDLAQTSGSSSPIDPVKQEPVTPGVTSASLLLAGRLQQAVSEQQQKLQKTTGINHDIQINGSQFSGNANNVSITESGIPPALAQLIKSNFKTEIPGNTTFNTLVSQLPTLGSHNSSSSAGVGAHPNGGAKRKATATSSGKSTTAGMTSNSVHGTMPNVSGASGNNLLSGNNMGMNGNNNLNGSLNRQMNGNDRNSLNRNNLNGNNLNGKSLNANSLNGNSLNGKSLDGNSINIERCSNNIRVAKNNSVGQSSVGLVNTTSSNNNLVNGRNSSSDGAVQMSVANAALLQGDILRQA